ncbi:hypothetical protein [Ensifer adhaerens]|uniref:hypothetical protein n=1 Tax=Ensifer adhaerens TaxID=106592 RepID=UPI001C4DE527|nr:hypothetical protein [Ensifer adhaerens]MBW0368280.1 hypothetical protein [Ensifer adhaerens]UCM24978.1 hypothetical protein LDL63_34900 [Ensifer adhaerens]
MTDRVVSARHPTLEPAGVVSAQSALKAITIEPASNNRSTRVATIQLSFAKVSKQLWDD